MRPPTEQYCRGGFQYQLLGCGCLKSIKQPPDAYTEELGMHHQTFAITELIEKVILEARLTDADFVRVLGYNNVNKGLRKLRSWRDTGSGEAEFLKRISSQFGVPTTDLQDSLIKTVGQLSETWLGFSSYDSK